LDSNPATVTINVNAVNDAPTSDNVSVSTDEDNLVEITLVGGDVDGDALTYSLVTESSNGTVSLTENKVTYTPNSNYNGSDSFTYKVNDGSLDSNVSTVTINVNAVNDAPTSDDVSVSMDEDNSVEITLVGGDVDGDALTYSLVTESSNGTVSLTENKVTYTPKNGTVSLTENKVTYTPNSNYNGVDTFTYKTNDGELDSNPATVTINVNAVNDTPISFDINASTDEDNSVEITLVGGDVNGTVSLTENKVTYTPNSNYNGVDTFTYKTNDGELDSNPATVTINVNAVNYIIVEEKIVERGINKINIQLLNNENVKAVQYDFKLPEKFSSSKDKILLNNDLNNFSLSSSSLGNNKYRVIIYTQSSTIFQEKSNVILNEIELDIDESVKKGNYKIEITNVVISGLNNKNVFLAGKLEGKSELVIKNRKPIVSDLETSTLVNREIEGKLLGEDYDNDSIVFSISTSPENGTVVVENEKFIYEPNYQFTGTDTFTYLANDGEDDSETATVSILVEDFDHDQDGILDSEDNCPDTPDGTKVNAFGCDFFELPVNNYKVEVGSATCIGNSDGVINLIVEDVTYDYNVSITGMNNVTITGDNKSASVTGLSAGTYTVCFKVDGQDAYEQCFEVNIAEPKALSAFIDVDNDNRTTSIQLSGSSSYNVEVNGQRFDVKGDRFTTNLPTGLSIIKISTDLDCQGIIEREIFISEDILYYPNPTQTDVNVHVSGEDTMVQVSVFSEKGDLIYTREQQIQDFSRKTNIDLSRQITGTYIVVMDGPTVRKTFKIVKKWKTLI